MPRSASANALHRALKKADLVPHGAGWKLGAFAPLARFLTPDHALREFLPAGAATPTRIHRSTPFGPAEGLAWRWTTPGLGSLEWHVYRLTRGDVWIFEAGFRNASASDVHLVDLTPLRTADLTFGGDARAWHMGTIGHGPTLGALGETLPSRNEAETAMWADYHRPVPHPQPTDEKSTDGRWREVMEYLTLYRANGDGFLLAPVGEARADLRHELFVEGGHVRLEVAAEMSEARVAPGEWRWGQPLAWVARPYHEAADLVLGWVARTHGHRTHRPAAVGWCSWYDQANRITDAHCRKVARAIKRLRPRLRFDVFQLDDGFQRQVGDWRTNEKFPAGLAPFVKAARASGCRPGIWMAPLAVHESLGWHRRHPEWFQRDRTGALINHAGNWGGKSFFLDPTHPDVARKLEGMLRAMKAEGFTYFKIDFNDLSRRCRWHDGTSTRLEAFRALYALYRRVLGEDVHLLACAGFTRGVLGYADATRIGPDSISTWRRVAPCNLKECIRAVGMTAAANHVWLTNDPDVTYMLLDWERCSVEQWRVWHGFVGLLGGLILTSDRFFDLPKSPAADSRLANLERILPPVPEAGRSYRAGYDPEHEVFGITVDRAWGRHHAIQVWNSHRTRPRRLVLSRRELGLDDGPHHVWSFWEERYLGLWTGPTFPVTVAPETARVLRITPAAPDGAPLLIGSSLHIGMGSVEFRDVRRHATTLRLEIADAGALRGVIALASARPLRVGAARGLDAAVLPTDHPGVWHLSVTRTAGAGGEVDLATVP